ncbi:enhanced intracellular survival protein Eis [Nonomuraea roseoviolacea subsp. roseoviolacea]|uniref:Acetyltransferase n=1 Tax=Nonomuraea roseoviolacea subsp. carminata TaxID=160689 RepID=A0ABT1K9L3_9ACTN|nr:GNAT family N-acetyltransferase [Nonomuraea roseoviolacea]MCP2350714.1 putative acetyltransferase [Nonomuraea roseoviolacea subsp. carminata]
MEIRDLTTDDYDDLFDVRRRSFGPVSPAERETWRSLVVPALNEGRYLGVFEGSRLAGAARLRAFTQWWHGRPQPLAGVAGVTVNPEYRGRGVGTRLMRAVVERAAGLGDAVSALYPATTPVYRATGYEHAGARHLVTIPTEALRGIRPTGDVPVRRMDAGDAAEVVALLHRLHGAARSSGPISWDERTWAHWLSQEDDFLYLAPDGYAVYRWDGDRMRVDNLVAGSPETARALWSLVGSASSITKTVLAVVAPDDPVLWLLRERSEEQLTAVRWMFRVLDVEAAVERRGFPSGAALDVTVEVEDAVRTGNTGLWRLTVAGGKGTATALPAGADSFTGPRLGINGLSALYAGVPTATLRRGGLLSGDDSGDEALDAAFAARPYMLDYF